MNFMGMNNNITDDLSSRIKIIIEPYEKKIKDLEEQIRQKDFEITVLKEKLYKFENNSFNNNIQGMNQMKMSIGMNQMGMGMNQMGMNQVQMPMGMNQMQMPMGMNQPMIDMNLNNDGSDIINLIFRFLGQNSFNNQINPIKKRCFIDDEFGFVQKKIKKDLKLNENEKAQLKFIFNSKKAVETLTVSELGMTNNSVIYIEGYNLNNSNISNISLEKEDNLKIKKTIIFKTSQGKQTNMIFDYDITIGSAIKKYLIRIGCENLINSNKIMFLYNASAIKENDKRILKDLTNNDLISIIVNDVFNLIGA